MGLNEILMTSHIRRWAGPRSYGRGEDYFQGGQVDGLKTVKDRIVATVHGTYPYHVVLWDQDGDIGYDCDCPVGLDGDFCKHCVATALAWLAKTGKADTMASRKGRKKAGGALTMKDVRAWLMLQKKEFLADMLVEAARGDNELGGRLILKAAAARGLNLATYRNVIDSAIGIDDFVDYEQMYDYSHGVDTAIDALTELLAENHADAVIELTEYALTRVERVIEYVDDSDGYMSLALEQLQELHLSACRKAKPDPVALAERLFNWELETDWDTFYNAITTYARVLGKSGIQRYRELAETQWAKIKPLKSGQHEDSFDSNRYRITRMMESLAQRGGDVEALVGIKQKDLSSSHDFLEIAQIYQKARQGDKALAWAEKGLKVFGDAARNDLRDFLADLYHRRKRHDEAMALIWPQFENNPGLGAYQHLKKHADRCKAWPHWRKRALDHLSAAITEKANRTRQNRPRFGYMNDRSTLVEIFLWEKDTEAAWREAQAGGCREALWIKLAGLREKAHPRDAIEVYQRLIGPIVDRTNNDAYQQATGLLRQVKKLMTGLGESAEFREYLAEIRVEYKRKRNFMKLLEKFK